MTVILKTSTLQNILHNGQAAQRAKQEAHIQKALASGNTAQLVRGPGGLYSDRGVEQAFLTMFVKPHGLASWLPQFPTLSDHPRYGMIGGLSQEQGAEPNEICEDGPTGFMVNGYTTARFGRIIRSTQTIEPGTVIRRIRRGELQDLFVVGNLLTPEAAGKLYPNGLNTNDVLDLVTKSQMVIAGGLMNRRQHRLLWTGDAANNVGNGYIEPPGLLNQLVTGQVDADTNTPLPSQDPLIIDFAKATVAAGNLWDEMERAEQYVHQKTMDTVGDATFLIAMRPEVWADLTEFAPAQRAIIGATSVLTPANVRVNIDGATLLGMRDDMRQLGQITLNGRVYSVVEDNAMPYLTQTQDAALQANGMLSSVVFLPVTVGGNIPATFTEYLDFSAMSAEIQGLPTASHFWTDGGQFTWAYSGNKWCYNLTLRNESRFVCRVPGLAFRIDQVQAVPRHIPIDPYATIHGTVDASPNHDFGGVQNRANWSATNNAPWA